MEKYLEEHAVLSKGEPDPEGKDRVRCFTCRDWYEKDDVEECRGLIYAACCRFCLKDDDSALVHLDMDEKSGLYCVKCRERLTSKGEEEQVIQEGIVHEECEPYTKKGQHSSTPGTCWRVSSAEPTSGDSSPE